MSDVKPTATLIADSLATTTGTRITTIEVTLHRYLLPYLAAHRHLSRTIRTTHNDTPAYPARWSSTTPGTTTPGLLPAARTRQARETWDRAHRAARIAAGDLIRQGVHATIANRLLEPFTLVTVTCTTTDWPDVFDTPDIDILDTANAIRAAYEPSTPTKLDPGHWHLPYLNDYELHHTGLRNAIHTSALRCAEDVYTGVLVTDREAFSRFWRTVPVHLTPLEHLATPAAVIDTVKGNLPGWHQLRHLDLAQYT